MWVGAHERSVARRNTEFMDYRNSQSVPLFTADHYEIERATVISEWADAYGTLQVDLSAEITGRKVVLLTGEEFSAVIYEPGIVPTSGSLADTPGFLFVGDDGDSLWFWPESESVAFRFEQSAGDGLRRDLDRSVDWLVSQGALVFCYQTRAAEADEPVFWFPELQSLAA